MRVRLIFAIVSALLEEVAIVAIVLWALPQIDVHLPWPGLMALMAAWAAYSTIVFRLGSRALRKQQVIGLSDMTGSKGRVVNTLAPEGLVRIKGELWIAKAISGEIGTGSDVIVVGQERLKLIVRQSSPDSDLEKTESPASSQKPAPFIDKGDDK